MAKREFLQLAHKYEEGKNVTGWLCSEKLDGIRCFWDGAVSTGVPIAEVPWANTLKDRGKRLNLRATGLWTRYLKPIMAPPSWLAKLPKGIPLDGELWTGRGQFQVVSSIVKELNPSPFWTSVKYCVFDSPNLETVLADGTIDNPQCNKTLFQCVDWCYSRLQATGRKRLSFIETYKLLFGMPAFQNDVVILQPQFQIRDKEQLNEYMEGVLSMRGEGLMLRNPDAYYECCRSHNILKYKPFEDAEGTVIGYVWGLGKYEGMMGAALVRMDNGKEFELSGFTDEERHLSRLNSGATVGKGKDQVDLTRWTNLSFPIGSRITFKYRELTDAGIPKEARYWRKA